MSEQASKPQEHILPLTSVRSFAALWVVFHHLRFPESLQNQFIYSFLQPLLSKFIGAGYLGVDLFFILSGFIISRLYFEKLAQFKLKTIYNFLVYRFCRIYPLHFFITVSLALVYIIGALLGFGLKHQQRLDLGLIISQLLMMHEWGIFKGANMTSILNVPSWSISAEWFAYLWFATVGSLSWKKLEFLLKDKALLSSLILVMLFLLLACNPVFIQGNIPRVLIGFSIGVCIDRMNFRVGAIYYNYVACLSVLLSVTLIMLDLIQFIHIPFSILIWALTGVTGRVNKIMSLPALVLAGEYSYSMYLIHWPLLVIFNLVIEKVLKSQVVFAFSSELFCTTYYTLYFATLIALSYATFRWYENPARLYLRSVLKIK